MTKPLEEIIKETDAEFFRRHPTLKSQSLSAGSRGGVGVRRGRAPEGVDDTAAPAAD